MAVTYPLQGQWYYPGPARLAGTASDASGVALVKCYLAWWDRSAYVWRYWNWQSGAWETTWPTSEGCRAVASGTDSWELTSGFPPWLQRGYYATAAIAFDRVGLNRQSSWIYFNTGDTRAPTGAFTYPQGEANYYPGITRIAGVASNGESGVNRVECLLKRWDTLGATWKYWNWVSQQWQTSYSPDWWRRASGTETWEISSALPASWPCCQTYGVYGRVYDNAGNSGDIPWLTFYIRETAPPTVAFTSPEAGAWYYPSPTFTGTASDAGSGVARVAVQVAVYNNASDSWDYWNYVSGVWETMDQTHWTDYQIPAEGTENWTVRRNLPNTWPCCRWYYAAAIAWDRCDNWTWIGLNFTVGDSTLPSAAVTSPESGKWYLPGTAEFGGTASDTPAGIKKVTAVLAVYNTSTDTWDYWNTVRRIWEPQDYSRWSEFQTPAEGTEDWTVQSGLPDTWPCCRWYWFAAIAYDKCGNSNWTGLNFYVGDNVAPLISSVTATPDTLWPPEHQMVEVRVTVDATDNYDPQPVSRITGVTCSEPADANGDGNTAADWEITGDLTLRLRAERAGVSTARVYTISVVCTDACGNATKGSVDVTVPHDQGF